MCTKGWTIECIICLIIDLLILSYPQDLLFVNLDTYCKYLPWSNVSEKHRSNYGIIHFIYSVKAISFTFLIFLAKFGFSYGVIYVLLSWTERLSSSRHRAFHHNIRAAIC